MRRRDTVSSSSSIMKHFHGGEADQQQDYGESTTAPFLLIIYIGEFGIDTKRPHLMAPFAKNEPWAVVSLVLLTLSLQTQKAPTAPTMENPNAGAAATSSSLRACISQRTEVPETSPLFPKRLLPQGLAIRSMPDRPW